MKRKAENIVDMLIKKRLTWLFSSLVWGLLIYLLVWVDEQLLDIAVGMSAKTRVWKNQKIEWSELVEKLTTEHKTNETYKEFISASKQDQSKIKDVGGYVGGYLRGGRRKPENVVHRQLVHFRY